METTVATLGKFASVGRRLAENITANRQAELNDAEQREQLVASVAEVRLSFEAMRASAQHGALRASPHR